MAESDGIERPEPGAPPTAFRLWKVGKIATSKGEFFLTLEGAQRLIAAQERQGAVDYPFDYDHKIMDREAAPEQRAAAGWHRLALRGDEIWIVNCRWTERAAKLIASNEYRYHSPTFETSSVGEIVAYFGCAITNTPATVDCQPVAASRQQGNATPSKSKLSRSQRDQIDKAFGLGAYAPDAPRAASRAPNVQVLGAPTHTQQSLAAATAEDAEERAEQQAWIAQQMGLTQIKGWVR